MNWLDWLKSIICNPTEIEPAKILGVITYDELKKIIPAGLSVIPLDKEWKITSKQEIERFLKDNKVDKEKFEAEYQDCDDFAIRVWADCKAWTRGLCFGFLWTKNPSHAMNFFVDNNKKLWALEPQSDYIKSFGSREPYMIIV